MKRKKLKLKSQKPIPTENEIKRLVKDYLSIRGWFHFHLIAGIASYPGAPDIIAIKNNRVLFIEAKRPGGKQSELQRKFQQNIKAQGGEYILASDINDLIDEGV